MKKLNLFVLTGLIIFLTGITLLSLQPTHQTATKSHTEQLIKQSYTVKGVHSKYIVAESNKYKNELINFYYEDQTKKQTFNINDKVIAYFKPYKNDYQIVDFKKAAEQTKSYDYVITGKDSKGYYGKSLSDNTGIFLVESNLPKGMTLNVHDSIRVSFPNNSYETITNVQLIKGGN